MLNYRNGKPYVKCAKCNTLTSRESGLCVVHYKQKWRLDKLGRTELINRTSQGRWINVQTGYVMIHDEYGLTYEHRVLAEKALGRPLPEGAVIHHTGERWDNHGPFKLVICPNQGYHALLHQRTRELGYA